MKRPTVGCAIGLAMNGLVANSSAAMQSAMSECRDEAISTGLEQEVDIQAYLHQCMQRFAGLDGYEEAATSASVEPSAEEPVIQDEPVN